MKKGFIMIANIKIENRWFEVYHQDQNMNSVSNITPCSMLKMKLDHNLELVEKSKQILKKSNDSKNKEIFFEITTKSIVFDEKSEDWPIFDLSKPALQMIKNASSDNSINDRRYLNTFN